jgi:hypothetical protein
VIGYQPKRRIAGVIQNTASCYTTSFPLTENPISEGGRWSQNDPNLTNVKTELLVGVQVAHGTMAGGGFDDSAAGLSGFNRSHSIQATVWKDSGITGGNAEVELHLSWSDTNAPYTSSFGTTTVFGYEININQNDDYMILGRFKATPELTRAATTGVVPVTGDIFKATFVYNPGDGSADITVYWNGTVRISYHDTTPPIAGNPGIGFYVDAGVANNKFGFTSITACNL